MRCSSSSLSFLTVAAYFCCLFHLQQRQQESLFFVNGFSLANTIVTKTKRQIHHAPTQQQQQQRRQQEEEESRNNNCVASLTRLLSSSSSLSSAISSNKELIPGIDAINEYNHELLEKLTSLRDESFFRLYSVDMLASCEYIPQQLFECYSETCEIYPIDDEQVPANIKTVDAKEHDFEIDGWARWDMPSDDYYDLQQFPEDYTGYDGADIWHFIHQRICFQGYDYDDNHWKADYNKAVSGLHSMVSAQIIRGISDCIESGRGFTTDDEQRWTDPYVEFQRRLSTNGETPLAMENLYFCFMLLLTAASRAKDRLLQDSQMGKISIHPDAARDLQTILTSSPLLLEADKENAIISVAYRKLHQHATSPDSVTALWEARMRTRELLRIMNCVQCNKCRLHGKIAMMGFSTALQILVGRTGEGDDPSRIHRVELAALISTLYKFSRAIETCQQMITKQQQQQQNE